MYIAYLNDLEKRWEDILEEYRSVSNTEKYFEKDLYVGKTQMSK